MKSKTVTITMELSGKKKAIQIDAHVLNHVFVAHSLNLHNWLRTEKEKLLSGLSENNTREDNILKVQWFHDTMEDIATRRAQMEAVESTFKDLCTI